MKYSVVIGTYNHCDDLLKRCVEALIKYTNLEDIELIIVANTISSISNTTGSLVVSGGAGISGNVYSDAIYTNGLF